MPVISCEIRLSDVYLEFQGREYREFVMAWLLEYYGDRCQEHCEICVLCQKWKAFDELFGDLYQCPKSQQPSKSRSPSTGPRTA